MSIILLVIICIPLVIAIPMWFQYVITETPANELALNLVAWFGYDGTFWLILLLGMISFSIGYVYIMKMKPGVGASVEAKADEEASELLEEEEETLTDEDAEEMTPAAHDDAGDVDLEDVDESLEDIEDNDVLGEEEN
jgi:hypothetical protein